MARFPVCSFAAALALGCTGSSDAARLAADAAVESAAPDAEAGSRELPDANVAEASSAPDSSAGQGGTVRDAEGPIEPDASDASDAAPAEASLWNGVDLSEWEGDPAVWRVEGGAIVALSPSGTITSNTFLIHRGSVFGDFVLRAQIWLGSPGNSGIQYRSARVSTADFRMKGYQADLGGGYWGALYEELGRGVLAAASDQCLAAARYGEWMDYEIEARGSTLVHRLGGIECVTYDETAADRPREGAIGLQYHVPGGFEARFRALTIRELGPQRR